MCPINKNAQKETILHNKEQKDKTKDEKVRWEVVWVVNEENLYCSIASTFPRVKGEKHKRNIRDFTDVHNREIEHIKEKY